MSYEALVPSYGVILSGDQNEEQIADVQEGNDRSYELTLGKPSIPSTSSQNQSAIH